MLNMDVFKRGGVYLYVVMFTIAVAHASECKRSVKEMERIKWTQASFLSEIIALKDMLWTYIIPEVKQCKEYRIKTNSSFNGPSFISDWIMMKSQDEDLSEVALVHGLGDIPYKIEVQVTPTGGPYAGWIFQGASVFQSDGDDDKFYGGVIYLYNESHVILYAPNGNNNGNIIYTGHEDPFYHGNDDITEKEAYVRVKVWGSADLPEPAFKSDWKDINIEDTKSSFYEIDHALQNYPAMVTVQIRINSNNYGTIISDGMGNTQEMYHSSSNIGGVEWASGRSSVRIWTYSKKSTAEIFQGLIGKGQNWGKGLVNDAKRGDVRILAWSAEQFSSTKNMFEKTGSIAFLSFDTFVQTDKTYIAFYVQANDVNNVGFRFYCNGNSQATGKPYGGALFAYTPYGQLRVWKPFPGSKGYLIHVLDKFGDGVYSQASNNATFGATLIQP